MATEFTCDSFVSVHEALERLRRHEISNNTRFAVYSSPRNFGNTSMFFFNATGIHCEYIYSDKSFIRIDACHCSFEL